MKRKLRSERRPANARPRGGAATALLFILIFSARRPSGAQTIRPDDGSSWVKADLHTHHTYKEPVEELVRRYREAGYGFVVVSNKDTNPPLDYEKFSTPELRIVNGVEQAFLTRKRMFGHVLGFPIDKPYALTTQWSLKEGYDRLRRKNRRAVLGVNHPHDGRWTLEDVMEAWREGLPLFELNSIDMKHGEFGSALWDDALSGGARMYATLVNDVHQIDDVDAYGHIMIRSETLELKDIARALYTGDFYAAETGCEARPTQHELLDGPNSKTLVVEAPGAARIRVISWDGNALEKAEYEGAAASHPLAVAERYVRAEILDPNGRYVFLQPFFFSERK